MSDFTDLYDEDIDEEDDVLCKHCGKPVFWSAYAKRWFENRRFGSIGPHECDRGLSPEKIVNHFDIEP